MTKFKTLCEFYDSEIKEYQDLDERLLKLMREKRITFGAYLVYSLYNNFHYEKISYAFKNVNKVTKWDISYHINNLKTEMKRTLEVVEENEKCSFEDSQMQTLIKSGEIQYL